MGINMAPFEFNIANPAEGDAEGASVETPQFGDDKIDIGDNKGYCFKYIFKNDKEKTRFLQELEKAWILFNRYQYYSGNLRGFSNKSL
jgi:hypothetical protein